MLAFARNSAGGGKLRSSWSRSAISAGGFFSAMAGSPQWLAIETVQHTPRVIAARGSRRRFVVSNWWVVVALTAARRGGQTSPRPADHRAQRTEQPRTDRKSVV